MNKPFIIEGIDIESRTVVVELDRSLLRRIAFLLKDSAPYNQNRIHVTLHKLGVRLQEAAKALYEESDAESLGFDLLDPLEEEVTFGSSLCENA